MHGAPQDMATLPGMSRYATKRVFIRQLDIRESSGSTCTSQFRQFVFFLMYN
jgi:hypothetical protein